MAANKNVYMIKIFENDFLLFESGYHWGLKKDAVAALQAMMEWYDRHAGLEVEGRLFCDTMVLMDGTWEQMQNPQQVTPSEMSLPVLVSSSSASEKSESEDDDSDDLNRMADPMI